MKTKAKTNQMKHKSTNLIPQFFFWKNFDNTDSIIRILSPSFSLSLSKKKRAIENQEMHWHTK